MVGVFEQRSMIALEMSEKGSDDNLYASAYECVH